MESISSGCSSIELVLSPSMMVWVLASGVEHQEESFTFSLPELVTVLTFFKEVLVYVLVVT